MSFIRKESLRDSYARKMKKQGIYTTFTRNGSIKKIKPIKKIAKSRRNQQRAYFAITAEFLALPENENCLICTRRREDGENIPLRRSVGVHHKHGRIGRLLCYVPYFVPSCFQCQQWPHEHPADARRLGLLSPAALWNVYPVQI